MPSCPGELHNSIARCDVTHLLQRWTGHYFWPSSLEELGLTVHLNHPAKVCSSPRSSQSLTVIDVNGIHQVNVSFCGCHLAVPDVEQLLRYGWYPGTTIAPQTAVTMSCLSFFHVLTLQSKVTAYDYYHTLSRTTDNAGIRKTKVCGAILNAVIHS